MTALEIALAYIARGWAPIPIPHKAKKPMLKVWQNLGITAETARQYFNGDPQNVGVQQGVASGGLTDVDLDCLEAIAAAPFFLPHRTARFGRASKPCSHWLYYTDLAQTEDKATLQFKDPEKHVILEIRIGGGGTGAQTVFPESTHPSGEEIEWVDKQDVARIGGAHLKTACGRIAACSLIARHYPKVGGRHDAALVFGGFLARCGFSVSEVKLFAEAVATASRQPVDKRLDIVKTAADCVEAFTAGREACGLNKMGETFGAAVAALCAKWLGYRASRAGGATGHDSAALDGGGLEFAGVEAAILAAPKHEACAVFVRLAMGADLDAAQAKLLAKAAGVRSGAGVKVAEKMLDEARAQRREAAAQAIRHKAEAESTRERIEGIFADDEIGPILRLLDDVLSRVDAPEPPMRDAEGWPVEVQCRESAGLHELTAEGANADESAKSRLASPKHFLLTRHEKESLEIEWGDHLCFIQKIKDGERYVAPPEKFLNHFLKYRRSKLPRAHAVLTMPLVLPDGSLLAGNGLDRKRRAVFRIDPALLAFMPKPEDCRPDEVAEAFKHLTDHWLVDVSTDLDGKCVLIALALSIIERVLFAERPVFFVTAGLRGGGKTTALMMVALAATGTKAAASAWSNDPDERKKALFSYLLECLPILIWDNIPRGATIGCPHIERASTCEFYQDRVLGVTKTRTAPAYTILAFTGNNIGPKSDQASRSLEARLTTDRPDPENRHFEHPDPIAWTLDHRGEILRALYAILLGNPQLDSDCRGEPETRFKTWWTVVGSAVEHAAKTAGKTVSFKDLFERVEAADEEASARADMLQALYALFPREEFTSANVLEKFEESAREAAARGQSEAAGLVDLKRFCTPRKAKAFSTKSIGHALGSIDDAPARVAAGELSLRSRVDTHAKTKTYWLELNRRKTSEA